MTEPERGADAVAPADDARGGDGDAAAHDAGALPKRVARRTVDGEVIEWLTVPPRAAALGLEPHPEGGWYRRTWTGDTLVKTPNGARPAATLILFLLPPGEASIWHRVTADEVWLWHGPGTVSLELGGGGNAPAAATPLMLGPDSIPDAHPQVVVPAGVWQRTVPSAVEALVSCVVSPGFSFDDFTTAAPPASTAEHRHS